MNKEEIIKEIDIIKETLIDVLSYDLNTYKEDIYNLDTKQVSAIFGLLDLYNKAKENTDRLQKELSRKDKLILDLKEKLNNIQFEVETAWRKIEKMENNNE